MRKEPAMAGDEAAAVIEAARLATAAYCAGDLDVFLPYIHPERTTFGPEGGRLALFDGAALRAAVEKGQISASLAWQDLQARVYGELAVSTGYLVGTWTIGGKSQEGTWRETIVWRKETGTWRVIHLHVSPCTA
jgi:ketosteroid isomerase-like protein